MKPEDFWKNITDDQFNAVVDKFGFSEEDLDDISTGRIIVCELAHGPSPYEHSYVDVTCGGEDCVDPKHLRWARLPSFERLMERIPQRYRSRRAASRFSGTSAGSGGCAPKVWCCCTKAGRSPHSSAYIRRPSTSRRSRRYVMGRASAAR